MRPQAKDKRKIINVMFINVRQRPHTVGVFVGADARTSVPTVRGDYCMRYILFACSCLRGRHKARPLQWIFVDYLRLRTLERASLQVGSGLLQSRGRPIVPVSSGRDAGSVPVYMHTPNAIKSHSSKDASWCVHIKVSTVSVPDFHACQPQSLTCICSLGV